MRERQTERETDRERPTDREIERDGQRETDRQRQTDVRMTQPWLAICLHFHHPFCHAVGLGKSDGGGRASGSGMHDVVDGKPQYASPVKCYLSLPVSGPNSQHKPIRMGADVPTAPLPDWAEESERKKGDRQRERG